MVTKLNSKSLGAHNREQGIKKTQDVFAGAVSVSYVNTLPRASAELRS